MVYINHAYNEDHASLMDGFANTAVIIDFDREIVGKGAIRKWVQDEVVGGRYYVVDSMHLPSGIWILVYFKPVDFKRFYALYTFRFKDGKINF